MKRMVELAYIIGQPQPCAINIELNNFGKSADMLSNTNPNLEEDLAAWIREHIDLSPKGIIDRFDGLRPRFYEVVRLGHFGHPDKEVEFFPWEKLDITNSLKKQFLNN